MACLGSELSLTPRDHRISVLWISVNLCGSLCCGKVTIAQVTHLGPEEVEAEGLKTLLRPTYSSTQTMLKPTTNSPFAVVFFLSQNDYEEYGHI